VYSSWVPDPSKTSLFSDNRGRLEGDDDGVVFCDETLMGDTGITRLERDLFPRVFRVSTVSISTTLVRFFGMVQKKKENEQRSRGKIYMHHVRTPSGHRWLAWTLSMFT
jgi:hypothetical protein